MKRGLLSGAVILPVLILASLILASPADAATLTTTSVNPTLETANLANAQNVYAYEITYAMTGDVSAVDFYDFLSLTPGDTTNGYNIRASNLSVYESRIDNTKTGITDSGNLFNVTHSGTLTLKSMLLTYNNGVEETTAYNEDGTTIVTITTVSGGGGGTTIQHYSIKIISPGDITLPKEGTIQVPVIIENPGQVSLKGIHLSANVSFNNLASEDIEVSLGQTGIAEIAPGNSREILITITANTKKQGIYKVKIYADVDNPKFSDWGEFYIEFKKTSESDADNALATAEQFISENPECLELTELINEAKNYMEERQFTKVAAKIQEATDACEKVISLNKKKSTGIKLDETIVYYAIIATAATLVLLVIFYVYRRIRYRKSKGNYS